MNSSNRNGVATGHYLATEAATAILANGGNAVDAGVAAGITLGIVHSDLVNFAGVAPMMIRMAATGEVVTIDGLGHWPQATDIRLFETQFDGQMPLGILRTVVPAAPGAWILALQDHGTRTFGEVAAHAIRHARDGFPVYDLFAEVLADNADETGYRATPENARIYLPGGRAPVEGENFVQADLARTLQYMADEEAAAGGSRIQGLQAARDAFYVGDIADHILRYYRENNGFLSAADLADYQPRYENPLHVRWGEDDIYTCGAWCQGISLAQAFAGIDPQFIKGLAHNSPAYIHYLTEWFKLVFADREQYVADPRFVDVPVDAMLDSDYLQLRRGLIDPAAAWAEMPPPGNPQEKAAEMIDSALQASANNPGAADLDTSYACVIDRHGNMFSATPSDTSATSEVVPGTGVVVSSRGSQSRGDSRSINCAAPGKRPRLTPNPALALHNGKPLLPFGTPGGDVQVQAMVQVFANLRCFDMPVDQAIDAPRFASYSFPSSFAPNDYHPGLLRVENRVDGSTCDALSSLGHRVEMWSDYNWRAGGVCAVMHAPDSGEVSAAADPRRAGSAFIDSN